MKRLLYFTLSLFVFNSCSSSSDSEQQIEQTQGDTTIKVNEDDLSGGLTDKDTFVIPHADEYIRSQKKDNNPTQYPELIIGKWAFAEGYVDNKPISGDYKSETVDMEFKKGGVYRAGNSTLGWQSSHYKLDGNKLMLEAQTKILVLNENVLLIEIPVQAQGVSGDVQLLYKRVKK